jgi:hypothetical protein
MERVKVKEEKVAPKKREVKMKIKKEVREERHFTRLEASKLKSKE